MDKLTAAQRRFGMLGFHTGGYTSKLPTGDIFATLENSESQPGAAQPFATIEHCLVNGRPQGIAVPTGDRFPLLVGEIAHKDSVIVELQRLLDEKDAEIDRLLEPTKWWRMLGWVIMAGTVLGVIAGVYEVIT